MNEFNVYPEPFITGVINYPDTREGKLHAIADALMAWGNAASGIQIPENFGKAMAEISIFLQTLTTPDALMLLADKL